MVNVGNCIRTGCTNIRIGCTHLIGRSQARLASARSKLPSFSQVSEFSKNVLSHSVGRVTGLAAAAISFVPSVIVGPFIGLRERYNGVSQIEGEQYGKLCAYAMIILMGGATTYLLQQAIKPDSTDLGAGLMATTAFSAFYYGLFGSDHAVPLFSQLGGALNVVTNLASSTLYGLGKGVFNGPSVSYQRGSKGGEWATEKTSELGRTVLTLSDCIRANPVGNFCAKGLQLIGEISFPLLALHLFDQFGVQGLEQSAKYVKYGVGKIGEGLGYEALGQLANHTDFTKGIERKLPLGLMPLLWNLIGLEISERVVQFIFSDIHPKIGEVLKNVLLTPAGASYIAFHYYSGNFEESVISSIAAPAITGLVSAANYLYQSEMLAYVIKSSPNALKYLLNQFGPFLSNLVHEAPYVTAAAGLATFGWVISSCFVKKKPSLSDTVVAGVVQGVAQHKSAAALQVAQSAVAPQSGQPPVAPAQP